MHNYKYLEKLILIIWSNVTQRGKQMLGYIFCHDSIAIYSLSICQLLTISLLSQQKLHATYEANSDLL